MKAKVSILFSLVLFSCPALAREFYSLPFEVTLTYSQMGESKLNMGTAEGVVSSSSDGVFSRLEVEGQEIRVERVELWAQGSKRRPRLEMEIAVSELLRIADLSNSSIWRSARTRGRVKERIEDYRVQSLRSGEFRSIKATYDDRTELNDLDLTDPSVQIHDTLSADSIHLEFDFENRCSVE
jgi:hypothetical protein